EVRRGGEQRDGEGRVVDDLEARQGQVLRRIVRTDLVEALDGLEERLALLRVRGVRAEVPGVDEALRGQRAAVGELQTLTDLDGPGLAVLGLDRLGDLVLDLALSGGVRQAREGGGDDAAAAPLAGVRRDQRVLRLAAVGVDGRAGAAGAGAAVRPAVAAVAPAGGEGQGGGATGGGAKHHGTAPDGHGNS